LIGACSPAKHLRAIASSSGALGVLLEMKVNDAEFVAVHDTPISAQKPEISFEKTAVAK
jgi:hypothetical protein